MSAEALATLLCDPVVNAIVNGKPERKAYLARTHPVLGPLLLIDSFAAAVTRSWNSKAANTAKMAMKPDEPRFEWLGVFRPAGQKPVPMFLEVYNDDEPVDGRDDAYRLGAKDMEFGGMKGATRLVATCQRDWPTHAAKLLKMAAEWTRETNTVLERQGKALKRAPLLADIKVKECTVREDGGLLLQILFGTGDAYVNLWDDGSWQTERVHFADV